MSLSGKVEHLVDSSQNWTFQGTPDLKIHILIKSAFNMGVNMSGKHQDLYFHSLWHRHVICTLLEQQHRTTTKNNNRGKQQRTTTRTTTGNNQKKFKFYSHDLTLCDARWNLNAFSNVEIVLAATSITHLSQSLYLQLNCGLFWALKFNWVDDK